MVMALVEAHTHHLPLLPNFCWGSTVPTSTTSLITSGCQLTQFPWSKRCKRKSSEKLLRGLFFFFFHSRMKRRDTTPSSPLLPALNTEMIPEVAAAILRIQNDKHEDKDRRWQTEKDKAYVFYGPCISKNIHQLDMQQQGSLPVSCHLICHQSPWQSKGNMAETLTLKDFSSEITQVISAQGRFMPPGITSQIKHM